MKIYCNIFSVLVSKLLLSVPSLPFMVRAPLLVRQPLVAFSGIRVIAGLAAFSLLILTAGYLFLLHQGAALRDLRRQLDYQDTAKDHRLTAESQREILQRIVFLDARDESAWIRLAQLHLALKEWDQLPVFFARWEQALARPSTAFWSAQGDASWTQGQFQPAIVFWQKARDLQPIPQPELIQKIGRAHEALGAWEEAAQFYEHHYELTNTLSSRIDLARSRLHLRQWSQAWAEMQACVALDPGHPAVKKELPAFERIQPVQLLFTRYEQMLATQPEDWVTRMKLALLFFDAELPDLAQSEARHAGLLQPRPQAPRLLQGFSALVRGDKAQAETLHVQPITPLDESLLPFLHAVLEADQILLSQPHHAEALTQRAWALSELGQNEPALRDAQDALEQNPNLAAANLIAGAIFLSSQQLTDALLHTSAATGLTPQNAAAWLLLGRIQQAQGDLTTALLSFTKAVTLQATEETLAARAECYRRLGDKLRAAEDQKRLEKLKP